MSRSLYVGGLDDSVTLDLLRAAFIPFGPLKDVQLPLDKDGKKHRGFAFVEFADIEDSESAVSNMDGAELFGRTIRVNVSRGGAASGKAVWAEAEKWWEGLKGSAAEEGEAEEEGGGVEGGQSGKPTSMQ